MSETVAEANRQSDADEGGRPLLRALGVALGLWFLGVVGGNLLGFVPVVAHVGQTGTAPEALPPEVLLVGQVLVDLTFLVVGTVYAKRWLSGLDLRLPTGDARTWVAIGLVGALTVWLGSTGLSMLLAVEEPTSAVAESFDETWAYAAFAVMGVVFIPVAEEVLFRGAIQRRLRSAMGARPAIGLASLAFLSVHLLNFSGGSALALGITFGSLFGVSLVIGYAYERTDNLAVPILVHVGYNAIQFGLSLAGILG